ncbi:MAG: ATP-binding protein [Caldilineaceae bacterium]|nr:ATP-binding protein [Caldilineaceae bacterium]MDE0463768.1 ATP-binding protein [Caldilineaceae bacterium]
MKPADELIQENETLRDRLARSSARLSRLSRASLRINQSLDFDAVLQSVLDSARSLAGARYGVLTLLDETGQVDDFLSSGLTAQEAQVLWALPDGLKLFEHLGNIPDPFRVSDLHSYIREFNLPEPSFPEGTGFPVSYLAAPIHHRNERVGNIFLAGTEEFTSEDEEILVMFSCQAALVIANARRYRDEQRARNDLETLINTSPVGVVVCDAEAGMPVSFNQEARRIVSSLQMPDRPLEELLEMITCRRADGREIALGAFPLAQVLRTGETVRLEEIVLEVPDGRSVKTLINATPIHAQDGAVESVVVTMQDMTPLEEMEQLRAEFMGMVSHELQTPLTSIQGSANNLLDETASLNPAEMRQYHRIISNQADRMRSLIRDLLDVAHIETGTLSIAPEPSDTAALVDEARIMFVSAGRTNSIHIDIAPDLPQVMTDRRRIVQVLSNLLSNAARHSNELSTITVRAVLKQFQVVVSISDEGRGIPAERLPLLFRKFSRVDGENRQDDPAGSGLGLAICKGIVEAHGGRIWAESDGPGQGARFIFTVPIVEKEETAATAEPAPFAAEPGNETQERTRILVVDDDPHALRYIRDVLSKSGYAPIVTGDPQEVDGLITKEEPHLVLLDMMLPGVDGIDLMRNILKSTSLPVIFLSAYGQENVIAKAFDTGAADYVVKPFSPTELAARIRSVLRQRAGASYLGQPEDYLLEDLVINYAERRVSLAGRPVVLTATEYALLFELSTNAGMVLTHGQLLQRVWDQGHSGEAGLVRTVVKRLRQKLGDDAHDPTYIFTEPRVGYRMAKPPST